MANYIKIGSDWKTVVNYFVHAGGSFKELINGWINIAGLWKSFFMATLAPQFTVTISQSTNATTYLTTLRGTNYSWTPGPPSLTYRFQWWNGVSWSDISTGNAINPSYGSSTSYNQLLQSTGPSVYVQPNQVNRFRFKVDATYGAQSASSISSETTIQGPTSVTLTAGAAALTSIDLSWTTSTGANRYMIYYSTNNSVFTLFGGTSLTSATVTGLATGTLYYFKVIPITGFTNDTGYYGSYSNTVSKSTSTPYAFTFGNTLHVGTNGYISLDLNFPNSTDAISSTNGRVIGILPGDLQQSSPTSIWYWSDTNQFIIRYEGYSFGDSSNLRQYEIVFDKNQNYATVYIIATTLGSGGVQAFVKDGVALTSYSAGLTTGNIRRVYFDGQTAPATISGPYVTKSKGIMKQVTGLTSGSTDIGYTSIATSINQSVGLTAPTGTTIGSITRVNDNTIGASINSSGGSGPYYQLYWTTASTAPVAPSYDAASTTSTVYEEFLPSSGNTYYFYIRSSIDNLGNTTIAGNSSAGTYSAYGPSSGAASYAFAAPTGGSASISGSTTSGSVLTLSNTTPSGAPTPIITLIIWRIANGGVGGNSFTGGTVMQTGGTTFTIPSTVITGSTVGYQMRAEVTYNNGLTINLIVNSNPITVTSGSIAPTNNTVPTLSGGLNVGDTFTFGVGTWNNTPTSYSLRLYRGTPGVATFETLVKDAGNVTESTYVIPLSDFNDPNNRKYYRAFATATNAAGTSNSGTYTAGQELGPITNNVTVVAPGTPTGVGLTGSGVVTWTAPTTGGAVSSYEIEFYTASNGTGSGAAGPYSSTGIGSSPYQLVSPYGGSGANWARVRVRARNAGGASSYSAWYPSSTTYV